MASNDTLLCDCTDTYMMLFTNWLNLLGPVAILTFQGVLLKIFSSRLTKLRNELLPKTNPTSAMSVLSEF